MENGVPKCGHQAGDVITKLDENDLKTSSQLQEGIARHKPGDKISLTVFRQGKTKTFNVSLKKHGRQYGDHKAYKDDVLKGLKPG